MSSRRCGDIQAFSSVFSWPIRIWKFASDPHDLVIRQLIATVRPYHRLLAVFETLATKTPKNRRRHEHERYVSRHLHWEQKQPSHDSLECPFRGDPPQQDARWDRGLESMGLEKHQA